MRSLLKTAAVIAALVVLAPRVLAEEPPKTSAPASTIPFKPDATPIEEHGVRWLIVVAAIGVVAAVVIHRARNKSGFPGWPSKHGRITLLESKPIAPRLTLFLIKVDQREILLARSGDHLVTITGPQGER